MRPSAHLKPLVAPLAFAVALTAAGAAVAQSPVGPDIRVAVGGELAEKADELGPREVAEQVRRLEDRLARELSGDPALAGARLELTLTDLEPNRPTFEQLGRRPGLSLAGSRSIGGARIQGELVTADGVRRPVDLRRYAIDLRETRGYATWTDAGRAFDLFARRIAEGRLTGGR